MQFAVSMPITMHVSILVEADDETLPRTPRPKSVWKAADLAPSSSGVINDIDVEEVD